MNTTENSSYCAVNGYNVWFEKFGSGPNIVLLIPGPIGTGRTDFEELLDGEDELDFNKFTVIAVEAPGWGRSRPPVRRYGNNTYANDCECFHKVMQYLGYDKYSIIGWSEGAKVALLMAIKYQDSIESLVLTAISTHFSNRGVISIMSKKSVNNWNKKTIDSYLRGYQTKDEIQKLWTRYIGFVEYYNQYYTEDLFKDGFTRVRCPVLLVHGDQDPIIEWEQPLRIYNMLSNVTYHRFPYGEHDSHKRYPPQFKVLVEDHILNKNKKYIKGADEFKDKDYENIVHNSMEI